MASESTSRLRHEWYQSDDAVVVSVFIKNTQKENVHADFQSRSVSLTIKMPTGSEVVFDLDPLQQDIDASASTVKVLSTKIDLRLVKAQAGKQWAKLEADPNEVPVEEPVRHPQYVTSSRKKTNWDALVRDDETEEKKAQEAASKDPNAGGDRALNGLFQQIYAGATDDQRRAMMKSYVESNGTTLSTNWEDIKKGPTKTQAPEGMVAKKF